jgi:hypothetical protein
MVNINPNQTKQFAMNYQISGIVSFKAKINV